MTSLATPVLSNERKVPNDPDVMSAAHERYQHSTHKWPLTASARQYVSALIDGAAIRRRSSSFVRLHDRCGTRFGSPPGSSYVVSLREGSSDLRERMF